MGSSREETIEQLVLLAIYEATTDSFFGSKAARLLDLRSDIDKKRKELHNSNSEVASKLKEASQHLIEAERLLGLCINNDKVVVGYIPIIKNQNNENR